MLCSIFRFEIVLTKGNKLSDFRVSRDSLIKYKLKRAQDKYEMTAFNSKWIYGKLAVVVRVPQTTQNLVMSRSCLAEDGKEMYKDL